MCDTGLLLGPTLSRPLRTIGACPSRRT